MHALSGVSVRLLRLRLKGKADQNSSVEIFALPNGPAFIAESGITRFLVCRVSQSQVISLAIGAHIEPQTESRQDFWRVAEAQADVRRVKRCEPPIEMLWLVCQQNLP